MTCPFLGFHWFAWDAWAKGMKTKPKKKYGFNQMIKSNYYFYFLSLVFLSQGRAGPEGRAGCSREERTDWETRKERQTGEKKNNI